jgi:hypothetical protein
MGKKISERICWEKRVLEGGKGNIVTICVSLEGETRNVRLGPESCSCNQLLMHLPSHSVSLPLLPHTPTVQRCDLLACPWDGLLLAWEMGE